MPGRGSAFEHGHQLLDRRQLRAVLWIRAGTGQLRRQFTAAQAVRRVQEQGAPTMSPVLAALPRLAAGLFDSRYVVGGQVGSPEHGVQGLRVGLLRYGLSR